MGQRLNIEIINDDKALANAYYHWSGFTSSAIVLTKLILSYFIDDGQCNLSKAIRLLKSTGASFTVKDNALALLDTELIQFISTDEDIINRNKGLISFSEEGMEETRYYEEGRVTINIESKNIDFDVFAYMSEEEYKKIDIPKIKNIDIDITNISFDEFDEFSHLFDDDKFIVLKSPLNNDLIIPIE